MRAGWGSGAADLPRCERRPQRRWPVAPAAEAAECQTLTRTPPNPADERAACHRRRRSPRRLARRPRLWRVGERVELKLAATFAELTALRRDGVPVAVDVPMGCSTPSACGRTRCGRAAQGASLIGCSPRRRGRRSTPSPRTTRATGSGRLGRHRAAVRDQPHGVYEEPTGAPPPS